jgi:hypothetical protein
VAWCFLQRADMDGVLDARNDLLPELPSIAVPNLYCKITISSFRLTEMVEHYQDEGWDVRPMLVVRDVRSVFNSLLGKTYGSNGTTAEEPPLRMRMRRFKQDWEAARGRWPILCYEKMLADAVGVLGRACEELGLAWDPAMLDWPKSKEQIADPGHGSPTFRKSRGGSFADTADASLAKVKVNNIPPQDLDWLEREFEAFNREYGYPEHADRSSASGAAGRAVPSFESTKRYKRDQKPLARIAAACTRLRQAMTKPASSSSGSGN